MDVELTEESEYLLCELYHAYRQRRNQDVPAFDAKLFGGSEQIQEDLLQDWPTHNIDDAALALQEAGFLDTLFADDELAESVLTNKAIAYMDHRFERNADKLLHRIAELRTILLG